MDSVLSNVKSLPKHMGGLKKVDTWLDKNKIKSLDREDDQAFSNPLEDTVTNSHSQLDSRTIKRKTQTQLLIHSSKH